LYVLSEADMSQDLEKRRMQAEWAKCVVVVVVVVVGMCPRGRRHHNNKALTCGDGCPCMCCPSSCCGVALSCFVLFLLWFWLVCPRAFPPPPVSPCSIVGWLGLAPSCPACPPLTHVASSKTTERWPSSAPASSSAPRASASCSASPKRCEPAPPPTSCRPRPLCRARWRQTRCGRPVCTGSCLRKAAGRCVDGWWTTGWYGSRLLCARSWGGVARVPSVPPCCMHCLTPTMVVPRCWHCCSCSCSCSCSCPCSCVLVLVLVAVGGGVLCAG